MAQPVPPPVPPPPALAPLNQMQPPQRARYIASFRNRSPPAAQFQNGWQGGRMLGIGGEGIAGLWVKADALNNITDRLVIKENAMSIADYNHPGNYYRDPPTHNPPPRPLQAHLKPREVFALQICKAVPPTPIDYIVNLRHYEKVPQGARWRQYLEFCEHGSLEDLINNHLGDNDLGMITGRPPRAFEEAFIWYVLECLAKAALQMQHPPSLDPNRNDPANSQIVHQDIKTQNILLAAPDPNYFPVWPIAKIADFGGARFTNPLEPVASNPDAYRGDVHTTGWNPHELWDSRENPPGFVGYVPQARTVRTVAGNPGAPGAPVNPPNPTPLVPIVHQIRIQSATNIWQIGRVVLAMMMLQPDAQVLQIDYYTIPRNHAAPGHISVDPWVPPADANNMAATYSDQLRRLVRRCLAVRLTARPTPTALLTACQNRIAAHYQVESTTAVRTIANSLRFKQSHDGAQFQMGFPADHLFTAELVS